MFKFHFYNEWKTARYITWLQTEYTDYTQSVFKSFAVVVINFTFLLQIKK